MTMKLKQFIRLLTLTKLQLLFLGNYTTLVVDPHVALYNNFKVFSLNLFFVIWTNLIKSCVFHTLTSIYYKKNHKCNKYNFCCIEMKIIDFSLGIQKVS